jgi:hypothetical protein
MAVTIICPRSIGNASGGTSDGLAITPLALPDNSICSRDQDVPLKLPPPAPWRILSSAGNVQST